MIGSLTAPPGKEGAKEGILGVSTKQKGNEKGAKGGGGEGGKIEICPLDVQSLSIVHVPCTMYMTTAQDGSNGQDSLL